MNSDKQLYGLKNYKVCNEMYFILYPKCNAISNYIVFILFSSQVCHHEL